MNPGDESDPIFSTSTVFTFSNFSANFSNFVIAASVVLPVEDPKEKGVKENV